MNRVPERLVLLAALLLLAACAGRPPAPSPSPTARAPAPVPSDEQLDRRQQALTLQGARRWAEAESLWRELIDELPTAGGPWANLGIVLARQARADEAVLAFEESLAHQPGNLLAWNWLGALHREAGRGAAAERAYLQALAIDPGHAATHHNLAITCEQLLGQPDRALRHWRRYRELSGDDRAILGAWIRELEERAAGGAPRLAGL